MPMCLTSLRSMLQYINSRGRRYLLAIVATSAFLAFAFNLRSFAHSRGQERSHPKDHKWTEVSLSYESKPLPPPVVVPDSTHSSQDSELPPNAATVPTPHNPPHPSSNTNQCSTYDQSASLIIALKTGATEALSRLPASLVGFLQCSGDDLLLFSDMEQDIGAHHIYDSLSSVIPEVKNTNNSDFDLYRDQYEAIADGHMIEELAGRGPDAWKLDKYKNIHIAQKSWDLRPDRKWYFFIDADTYVFYPTLFKFLERYDPEEKWYFGSAVWVGKPPYAHGGSGYIISGAAMKELVGPDRAELAARSDLDTSHRCCGDESLAQALNWKGVNITNVRPIIQGERTREIAFGERRWCHPVLTTHHVGPEEINTLWMWEQSRANPNDPITQSELFTSLISTHLFPSRTDWDNGAFEREISPPQNSPEFKYKYLKFWYDFRDRFTPRPWASFDSCKQTCKEDLNCLTFVHHGQSCVLSPNFRFGRQRKQESNVRWESGWDLQRIEAWRLEKGQCNGFNWEPDDS